MQWQLLEGLYDPRKHCAPLRNDTAKVFVTNDEGAAPPIHSLVHL